MTPEVLDIALSYMEGLDCARSLSIAVMLRHGEWGQIFACEVDPAHYNSPESYRASACATDFLRKLDAPGLVPGLDLEALAIEKWLWAERECFRTNRRINEIHDFGTLNGVPVPGEMIKFFDRLRKNLLKLIGGGPGDAYDGRFGPGATVSDRSGRTNVLDKMSSVPTLTPGAAFYLVPFLGTKWGEVSAARGDEVGFVRGNSFFTVPKTALTRRSCAKEPSLNGYFQLGLGRVMRNRLKRQGLDLDDGQSVHRLLACKASSDGTLCTIDLSSASDTLCESLVRNTLPPGWFSHLQDLRSPFTRVKRAWHRLEKFSSMGNGFTFELETAVFAAICMTVMGDDSFPGVNIHVYGDDIIVPREFAREVLSALRFCGFTPNVRKTFTEGYFRESCGGDFFDGQPVRAYFLKELPYEPQHYISIANGLRRVISSFGREGLDSDPLFPAWARCVDLLPHDVKTCRGPGDLGDIVIHDIPERWSFRWRANGIRYFRAYKPISFKGAKFGMYHQDVQYAGALYGVQCLNSPKGQVGFNSLLPDRNGVTGYAIGWVPFS